MNHNTLRHTTQRFLMDRLERLHDALQNLGQRLRASIAQIIGTQIGDAVQEAIEGLLHTQPIERYPDRRLQGERWPDHHGYPYGPRESGFWGDYEPEPDEDVYEPEPEPKPQGRVLRWRTLLTGLVQLASWWWQRGPKRPSLQKIAFVGAAVVVSSLIAGPVAGGVVMTITTTVLLTRMADGVSDSVRQLTNMSER